MKIVDVNILLYTVNTADPFHLGIQQWWDDVYAEQEPIGMPWMSLTGFIRLATARQVFRNPLTTAEAMGWIETWMAHPLTRLVQETNDHWKVYRGLLEKISSGKLAMDAHLAAIAISHDATLVSCDADFSKFRGLRWENPLAE